MHALDDDDLLELTHELSALGGSTAKIGKCRAFCTDDAGPGEAAADGGPRFTLTEGPEGPQWYHDSVTGTEVCDAHDRTSIPAIAAAEAEWVVAGFNTTVLAFGQATPDKSRALYGAPVRPAAEAAPDSLCGCGVRALFQAAAARYPDKSWHVALSAFEVRPPVDEARPRTHCTVDLLAGVALQPPVDAAADKTRAVTQQYGDGDDGCFAPATPQQQLWGAALNTIRIGSPAEFSQALALALMHSVSWTPSEAKHVSQAEVQPEGSHSHVVLKLMLGVPHLGLLSCLHLVDVIGTHPRAFERPGKAEAAAWAHQELLAVTRLVSEVAARAQGKGRGDMPLQARDTTLTRVLAPLLCGNGRCTVLTFLHNEAACRAEAKALRGLAAKASAIAHPCVRSTYPPEAMKSWTALTQPVDLGHFLQLLVAQRAVHEDALRRQKPKRARPAAAGECGPRRATAGGATGDDPPDATAPDVGATPNKAQEIMDRLTSSSLLSASGVGRASGEPPFAPEPGSGDTTQVLDDQREALQDIRRNLLACGLDAADGDNPLPLSLLPPTSSIHVVEDEGSDAIDEAAALAQLRLSPVPFADAVVPSVPPATSDPGSDPGPPSLATLAEQDPALNPQDSAGARAPGPGARPHDADSAFASAQAMLVDADGGRPPASARYQAELQHLYAALGAAELSPRPKEAEPPSSPEPESVPPPRPAPAGGVAAAGAGPLQSVAVRRLHSGPGTRYTAPRGRSESLASAGAPLLGPTRGGPVLDAGSAWHRPRHPRRGQGYAAAGSRSSGGGPGVGSKGLDVEGHAVHGGDDRRARVRDVPAKATAGVVHTQPRVGDAGLPPAPIADGRESPQGAVAPERARRLEQQRLLVQQLEQQLHHIHQDGLYADVSIPDAEPGVGLGSEAPVSDPPSAAGARDRAHRHGARTPPRPRSPGPGAPSAADAHTRAGARRSRSPTSPRSPGHVYQQLVDLKEARRVGIADRSCAALSPDQQEHLNSYRRQSRPEAENPSAGGPEDTAAPAKPGSSGRLNESVLQYVAELERDLAAARALQEEQGARQAQDLARLQGQLDASYHPILQTYEAHIQRLQREVEGLQRDKEHLTDALHDSHAAPPPEPAPAVEAEDAPPTPPPAGRRRRAQSATGRRVAPNPYAQEVGARQRQALRDRRVWFVEKQLQESRERQAALQAEVFELKKQVRLGTVHAKLLQDCLAKAEAAQSKAHGADAQHARLRQDHAEVVQLLEHATAQNARLERREADLKQKLQTLLAENADYYRLVQGEGGAAAPRCAPLLSRQHLPGERPNIARLFASVREALQGRLQVAQQQAACRQMVTQQQLQAQAAGAKQQLGRALAAVDELAKEVEELEHDLLDAAVREHEYSRAACDRTGLEGDSSNPQ